jgi:hypothetical protein
MYTFYTRLVEACLHPLCSILQYAGDLVVYILGRHVEAVRDCLQTSLTRLMTWFGDLSANKSEMMVFSRKHENPQVSVRLGQIALRNEFKYLGIIFDRKLTWRLHAEYIQRNERFLVSALDKPNDLLMVKLDELHRIWMTSNCLPEWQIVRESRI